MIAIGRGGIGGNMLVFMSLLGLLSYRLINTCLGTQLKMALQRANKGAKIQCKEADSMTHAWLWYVPSWRKMVLDYKKDQSKPNPFEEPDPCRLAYICIIFLKLTDLGRWCTGQIEDPTRDGRVRAAEGWYGLPSWDLALRIPSASNGCWASPVSLYLLHRLLLTSIV